MQGMISEMDLQSSHNWPDLEDVCKRRGVRRLVLVDGLTNDDVDALEFEVEFHAHMSDGFSFYAVASALIELFGSRANLNEHDGVQDPTRSDHDFVVYAS